jgi:serine/threonine protein kinase
MLLHTVIGDPGCSGQTLSHKQKASIFRDMLQGLQHLHSRSIVHSSLRPSALVVHFDSQQDPTHTQILDLAGAAVLQAVSTAVGGSFAYMPPEKLLGLQEPSTAGDVWSAGLVAAFVFLGTHAISEPHVTAVVECLRHNAVENMLSVVGFAETTEVEVLRQLPHWNIIYETPEMEGLLWQRLDQGGGPGAEHLLRRMLALSLRRQVAHKPNS